MQLALFFLQVFIDPEHHKNRHEKKRLLWINLSYFDIIIFLYKIDI